MWVDVDDVTDRCAMNDPELTDEQCKYYWDQWHKYTELEKRITNHILNEYERKC